MTKPKFDTNEEYWRWFEKKDQERMLNDYFGPNAEVIGEEY